MSYKVLQGLSTRVQISLSLTIYFMIKDAEVKRRSNSNRNHKTYPTWTACLVFCAGSLAPALWSDVWRAAEAPLTTAGTAAGAAVAACSGTGWRTDPGCSSNSHYTLLKIKHTRFRKYHRKSTLILHYFDALNLKYSMFLVQDQVRRNRCNDTWQLASS